jgi:hypothetical protein
MINLLLYNVECREIWEGNPLRNESSERVSKVLRRLKE